VQAKQSNQIDSRFGMTTQARDAICHDVSLIYLTFFASTTHHAHHHQDFFFCGHKNADHITKSPISIVGDVELS
jgi:hypothetical protein